MAGHTNLARQNNVLSNPATARQTGLAAEQGILTNVAGMPHLDEVIHLRAPAEPGYAHRGAVDAGICLHFDSVLDDNRSSLNDLVIGAVSLAGESESVTANNGAVLQDDIIANLHILSNDGVGVGEKTVPDSCATINHDMALDDAIVTDFNTSLNHHIRANRGITAQLGFRSYDCGWMNAGLRAFRWIEKLERLCKIQIGIGGPQNGAAGVWVLRETG